MTILFKGNTVVDIENQTGGYIWTDEGRVYVTLECTFTVIHKNLRFGVEARLLEDDHDMYSISIYDQSSEKDRYRRENLFDNPNNPNEVCHCFLDSTGGGTCDEELTVGINEVDEAILSTLFGKKDVIKPLIKPF